MLQNRKPPSEKKEGMANVSGVSTGATFTNQQHKKLKHIAFSSTKLETFPSS